MKRASLLILTVLVAGCAGRRTTYVPPTVDVPPTFKENANWKIVPAVAPQPASNGAWWEVFGDPELNALERQINEGNPTLQTLDARYAEARAVLRTSQSQRYPQVSAGPTIAAVQPSGYRAFSSFHDSYADYIVPASASYEADLWGRVRSSVVASRATAQATSADVESARLSFQGELASDYFSVHGLDLERQLLNEAVVVYERALELTQNRFRGGIASQADVAQAETQLETTRAQAVDVDAQRALLEHSAAVLIGQPPSMFSLPVEPLKAEPPDIPAGIPSDLLERRPDIAAAERRVASANAQINIATAAYYPLVTLSGATGFESSALGTLLTGVSSLWTVGPAAVQSVFDAGRRHAQADQARAAYMENASTYQTTVLAAFREVEDQLATLRILEDEAVIQDRAVAASQRALDQANNRYRGGVASYLEVVVAQTNALNNERVAARLASRRMIASVLLLKVIGGSWRVQMLPTLSTANR